MERDIKNEKVKLKPHIMTTFEILSAFMKGNEVASISHKQKDWLLSQARREFIKTNNDGFNDYIYFEDCHYKIKAASVRCGGYGGTVGHKYTGRYNLEKFYTIQFLSTGLTEVCHNYDMVHHTKENHLFKIINQL